MRYPVLFALLLLLLLLLLLTPVRIEGAGYHEREYDGGIGVHLDWLRRELDLAPRDGFVGPSARVAAIELLARVDEDRVVGAIAHQIGIADVMLHDTTAQDDHAGLLGKHRLVVDALDVCEREREREVRSVVQ